MALIHEELSRQFHDWEVRGRGWKVYGEPVRPEPPFRPFEGHFISRRQVVDDGRRPTFLSSLVQNLANRLGGSPQEAPTEEEEGEEEPEPQPFCHNDLVELRATLPRDLNITREAFGEFLSNLSLCHSPLSFEIVGSGNEVAVQFACDRGDAPLLHRQLEAHFPDGTFVDQTGALENAWHASDHEEALVVEFGLEREFMFLLRTEKADPFVGIVGALSKLTKGEIALFQVLFEPLQENWKESIEYSVSHADGKPFFVNATELAAAGRWKAMYGLYAAVVRIGILSESFERTLAIARDLAGSLRVFSNPQGNALIPLENDEYPFDEHVLDLLGRNSRRSGMILTSDELAALVHLPSSSVRSPSLVRESGKTKRAPAISRGRGILLGKNTHAGESVEVRLDPEARVRHMHVIGASGTGKSNLLFNLIRSDIDAGEGLAVLDPHGDLIDRILTVIPPERIGDVILVDPSDEEYSIGFNILSAHSDLEKTLLASDLISVFQRLSTSWGDQMGSVLQNAILAFLESSRGGTLADLRRFLIEPPFRQEFLDTVRDPDIVYYWRKGFAQLSGNKSIGSVLTRLETFLAPKPIRYMVSQKENRLDFGEIMDSGKIFLAKLPQGKMGKENSYLLGSLFVSKFQQMAMSRQDKAVENRRDFWLYLDEFHNFITPSMAEILSGARKYRMGLILAHQELRQLDRDREVGSAVLTNPFTRVIFRVGDADARALENGLSFFEAKDLQNLETGEAIGRVEKANGDFNLSIPFPETIDPAEGNARRKSVVEASRKRYGTPRSEIEAMLFRQHGTDAKPLAKETSKSVSEPFPSPARNPPPSPKLAEEETSAPPFPSEPPPPASAKEGMPSREPEIQESKIKPISRDLGQGGSRHKIIQRRIKEAAEGLGFRATIEKSLPESEQRFDVFLEQGDITIACETSFETTIDHEVGNVLKCLRSGVTLVAIVCLEKNRLQKIRKAVIGTFSEEESNRVQYFEPTEFLEFLKSFGPLKKEEARPKEFGGRMIKRSVSNVSAEERVRLEAEYYREIAEDFKKQRKRP